MDFSETQQLMSRISGLDRWFAPRDDPAAAATMAAAWSEMLRDVPLDFATHVAQRYYNDPDLATRSLVPGVIYQAWRNEEDRLASQRLAALERQAIEARPVDSIIRPFNADVSNEALGLDPDDVPTVGQVLAGMLCPDDLREQMDRDIAAGKAYLREERPSDLRHKGTHQFRYDEQQKVRERQERLRSEYREPEVVVEATEPLDIAERHCGNRGCHCPHTRCRGGWLDGRDVLRESRFGPTHEGERCPTCWDAVLMRGERV